MPSLVELINALPEHDQPQPPEALPLAQPVDEFTMQPIPLGGLRRMGLLGTLQAKIAAAYLFYWIRGWFKGAAANQQALAHAHWKTAARVLDSMSYLRGATMKVGQTLASYPDIVPDEFVKTLEALQFNARPMHWSLLREMVQNELGSEPEEVFAHFEKRAFAAASLGQVHAAQLKSGRHVAVKIQYPGIARTIRQDFRNLQMFMLPARLTRDWENTKEQFEDLRTRLERETDYEREAATMEKARALFNEDDGIVVPRVYRELSTSRVLTMDRLPGVHLSEFLATSPSQEVRNEFARKLFRVWYRMLFAGRMLYADMHPGNFLFMEDGRLGVVDFGCMVELDETLWDLFRKMDEPLTTGDPEKRREVLKEWSWISDDPHDADRLRLSDAYTEWSWQSRYTPGAFDFGNEAEFRRGIDLFVAMFRKRYSRGRACTPVIARQQLGCHAMLYRLGAKIEVAPIAEEEVRATGWDRSAYAPFR